MCAEGHSAGSGALAYALAWYNAGAATATNGGGYLDHVVLDSGPVFSDIQRGNTVNTSNVNGQYTLICVSPGQTGCMGWPASQDPPGFSLEYTTGYKTEVNQWSGNNTLYACANNSHYTTYDAAWSSMSILATSYLGQTPSFNYTNTTMSAYLCESTTGAPMNNVAAEGQLYYAQFTDQSQAGHALNVYAVTNCPSTEGIYEDGTQVVAHSNALARDDIYNDMHTSCVPSHGIQ
jgi:hypothetical protein